MGVIVGFNRRRDSYQVPAAFGETGDLDAFITDYYAGVSRPGIRRLAHRRDPRIPAAAVVPSGRAWAMQLGWELRRRYDPHTEFPSDRVDSAIGRTIAAAAARRPDSDLFVYSDYALESFQRRTNAVRRLFRFHPTLGIIEAALADDDLVDARPWRPEIAERDRVEDRRAQAELEAATGFVCASSMTRDGLVRDGVPVSEVEVVPYGCDLPPVAPSSARSRSIRFLYVGQGVRRKGLHTLLAAWREAALPGAELVAVCLRIDTEIADMAADQPSVTIRTALSRDALDREYDLADTVVVPSLVEGFGLVLLEGLARGARLIASDHTGAVDLGLPPGLCSIVEAGRVPALAEALRRAADTADPARSYAEQARRAAQGWSWERFRSSIRTSAGYGSPVPSAPA